MEALDVDALYSSLDPLITKTTQRIAYYYRHKNPADFADIQQNVRIDMWKALPKLLTLATDEQSLTRLVVTAINYSFKVHYKGVKKYHDCTAVGLENETLMAVLPKDRDELLMDLDTFPARVVASAQQMNRFKGNEGKAVEYCVQLLANGRSPSRKLVQSFYNVTNTVFFMSYATVLLKICVQKMINASSAG
jgi:hypothetical protein